MKKVYLFVILITALAYSYDPYYDYDKYSLAELKSRHAVFRTMAILGSVVGGGGCILFISGIVKTKNSNVQTSTHPGGVSWSGDDPEDSRGPFMIIGAVTCIAGGTVLGVIGLRKAREYKRGIKFKELTLNVHPGETAIAFTFDF